MLDNVRKSLASAVEMAGLDRDVCLHALRHTFAVTLARAGVPLIKLSKALGHASTQTTELHTLRFYPDEAADVVELLPELG